jgi:hypothetical protein
MPLFRYLPRLASSAILSCLHVYVCLRMCVCARARACAGAGVRGRADVCVQVCARARVYQDDHVLSLQGGAQILERFFGLLLERHAALRVAWK